MKAFLLFNLLFFSVFCAFSQDYLSIAHDCYDKGDYDCARDNFQNYLKKSPNDEDIKVLRKKAGECSMYKVVADKAYNEKNYQEAIENYRAILDINPHDSFAKARLKECNNILNPVALSVSSQILSYDSSGGEKTIAVSTNSDSYSIINLPEWCTYTKDAEILKIICITNNTSNPRSGSFAVVAGDKEIKIDIEQSGFETILNLSATNLSFNANGGNMHITITSKYDKYEVTQLPTWCSVIKYSDFFVIYCSANYDTSSRKNWFKVSSGDKEIWVTVIQEGAAKKVSTIKNQNFKTNSYKCFNCPFEKNTFGLSIGYVDKLDPNYGNLLNFEGIHVGMRIEPLFKYGFGINTGIFYEYYSSSLNENLFYNNYYEFQYEQHVVNIPLHLEYRLNFSKYFNLFGYGGVGFDFVSDSYYDINNHYTSLEFGGGIRIDHVQFNIGQSFHTQQIDDIYDLNYLYNYQYKRIQLSLSYMF